MRLRAVAAVVVVLAAVGQVQAGGHGGGRPAPHVRPPKMPHFSPPKMPHFNPPKMPRMAQSRMPKMMAQPRSYYGSTSHPVTQHPLASHHGNTGQGAHTAAHHTAAHHPAPAHNAQPGASSLHSGSNGTAHLPAANHNPESHDPASSFVAMARLGANPASSAPATHAGAATSPATHAGTATAAKPAPATAATGPVRPILTPTSPGLAGPTTPGGRTPMALTNPLPIGGSARGALVTTNPIPTTPAQPANPVVATTPTTPTTPTTTPTNPNNTPATPLSGFLAGGFGNPYFGYGGYGGRYYHRPYYGYGGRYYGRRNNNYYYFAHMRAISRLARDLANIGRGGVVATGQANRIRADLMAVEMGYNRPNPVMVQQMAMDLTQILPTRTGNMFNANQLARDLAEVMNARSHNSMQLSWAIMRAHNVLRGAGVPQQGARTLMRDMNAIASFGNTMPIAGVF